MLLACATLIASLAALSSPDYSSASLRAPPAAPRFNSSVVFSGGLSNISCFRIPSVVQAADGTLVAFAEARRGSCGDGDSHEIASRVSTDGGITWEALTVAIGNESSGLETRRRLLCRPGGCCCSWRRTRRAAWETA